MDRLIYALQVTLIGFSVVMAILFLLYLVFELFNRIFHRPAKAEGPGPSAPSRDAKPAVLSSSAGLSPRIVAAITAAVAGYMQAEGLSPGKITVTLPPRPTGTGSSWVAMGRKRLLEGSLELERLRLRRNRYREKI